MGIGYDSVKNANLEALNESNVSINISDIKQGQNNILDQVDNIALYLSNDAKEFESLTIDNTSGGIPLTSAKYSTYKRAYITVETAPFRYTVDGTAPTSSLGHLANIGDTILLNSNQDISAFRAIRSTSTSAVIMVTYSDNVV